MDAAKQTTDSRVVWEEEERVDSAGSERERDSAAGGGSSNVGGWADATRAGGLLSRCGRLSQGRRLANE